MGEILNEFALKFNGSVRLEARAERLTGEAGAVVLRVRTHLLLLAQGWRDQDDADALREDAALRLAVWWWCGERTSSSPTPSGW